ncbi:hypothetical protein ABMA28_001687 [Loxostege sticticalis]|uniref:Zinc finger DNA binding protein n=1 Tax=Loxostege sticticalis TaxID=481309 RepID=A0ABD0T2J6_LOXSC
MVLVKCGSCKKNITKKAPGLVCSRCNITVHSDPSCAKLSNKQINTLRNSPSIEWSCEECMKNVSRRSSFFTPDEEADDDDSVAGSPLNTQQIDTQKLIKDISRELKKTFREEIGNLETSIDFMSEQLSTIDQTLKKHDNKIKELENKNQNLQNINKNLELRVSILEQEVKSFQQKSLSNMVEIAGLPEPSLKDVEKVLETLASELNTNVSDIQSSKCLPSSKDRSGPILVEMKTKAAQKQWIEAGKEKCLSVGTILPDSPKEVAEQRVYIREALTKHLKTLLYNTKAKLNKIVQYIWCRDGKVLVRKGPNTKIYYVRSDNDIELLLNQLDSSKTN